jgi:hypothetical protein
MVILLRFLEFPHRGALLGSGLAAKEKASYMITHFVLPTIALLIVLYRLFVSCAVGGGHGFLLPSIKKFL